jgi:hypothetical protein
MMRLGNEGYLEATEKILQVRLGCRVQGNIRLSPQ